MARNTKSLLKSALPALAPLSRWMSSAESDLTMPSLRKIFSEIYLNNSWANDESVSGRGSTLARTEAIRTQLSGLLESIGAKSLLDAACGDFNWMRHTSLTGVAYLGVDIVPELIANHQRMYEDKATRFAVLDITHDELPQVDAILCRDCLIHLSFEHGLRALDNFKRSGSRFLLATTHTGVTENSDIESGAWRNVNLQLPPYNLPEPLSTITEDHELGKALGLWSLNSVPSLSHSGNRVHAHD
jgi:SAM-dependent methyltransferase